MAWFQLDPDSVLARMQGTPTGRSVPSLGEFVLRGALGFMLVGAIGFAPWAIFERWFRTMRETQLYIACTLAFILASGPLLHRLIIGPGSLSRFYKVFALAFTAYAAAWITCWELLRGSAGEFFGLLAGSIAMGAVIARAFGTGRTMGIICWATFLGNVAGYYAGDWIYHANSHDHRYLAMTAWGVCYGVGFGAGLGVAFYMSQAQVRARLKNAG